MKSGSPETLSLATICQERNINAKAFTPGDIAFSDPLEKHVDWCFEHIYSILYPGLRLSEEKIARLHHGIQHVTRAALYVPVLVNLYSRYGNKKAQALTDDEIKLLQIALLFHDAARLNEGRDEWDKESAALLYHYLVDVLKVDTKQAAELADAVANKDATGETNIYRDIIHDADCLDILRARPHFDATHLHFYQQIAKDNTDALDDMALLICEARSIIECQGDGFERVNTQVKKQFENKYAYKAILPTMQHTDKKIDPLCPQNFYKIIPHFLTIQRDEKELQKKFIEEDKDFKMPDVLDEKTARQLLNKGQLFARSINIPSGFSKKEHLQQIDEKEVASIKETLGALEIYKMGRGNSWEARTHKKDKHTKQGNPKRSVSMLGNGASAYGCVGFLIVPELKNISYINKGDFGTGRGKKKIISVRTKKLEDNKPRSNEEKQKQLKDLLQLQKMGGNSEKFPSIFGHATHNEIIYDIHKVNGIYFSNDHNYFNMHAYNKPYNLNPYVAPLQAIYLRDEYCHMHKTEKKLPLFEYSGVHNNIVQREYTDDQIVQMWVEMCSPCIKNTIDNPLNCADNDIEKIKVIAMYGKNFTFGNITEQTPADCHYPPYLKKRINAELEKIRQKLMDEKINSILKAILENNIDIYDDKIFFNLLQFPEIYHHPEVKKKFIGTIITGDILHYKGVGNYSDILYQGLYIEKDVKYYYLAKKMGMNTVINAIQSKLLDRAQQELDVLERAPNSSSFIQIFCVAKTFDIADQAKDRLQLSLDRALEDLITKKDYHKTHEFFNELDKHQLITDEITKKISAALNQEHFEFKATEDCAEYFKLFNKLQESNPKNIDLDTQKTKFLTYFDTITFISLPSDRIIVDYIIKNNFITDRSNFCALIRKLTTDPSYPFGKDYSCVSIFDCIRDHLPGKKFTDWQQQAISNLLLERPAEYEEHIELYDNFEKMLDEISFNAKYLLESDVFFTALIKRFASDPPQFDIHVSLLETYMPENLFNAAQKKIIASFTAPTPSSMGFFSGSTPPEDKPVTLDKVPLGQGQSG